MQKNKYAKKYFKIICDYLFKSEPTPNRAFKTDDRLYLQPKSWQYLVKAGDFDAVAVCIF